MKKTFKMSGVDCANCAAKMERGIAKIDGVDSCSINFMLQKLTIETESEDIDSIIEQAAAVCKKVDREAMIIKK